VKGLWPVFKRELFALFVTPTAWALIVVFLALSGLQFYLLVHHFATTVELSIDRGPLQVFFGESMLVYLPLVLLCPGITMRVFAEERRTGTIELLLTAPVGVPAVVLGKYLAALVTYIAMWAPTLLYVVVLRRTGDVDWRVVGTSYLGVLAIGAMFLAIGTLMSAIGRTQLVALVLSALGILGLFFLGIGELIFDDGLVHSISSHVSIWSQMGELSKGIVSLRRLVLDATLVFLPLFVTVRTVDAWRWG
jgi:ABC-2 type transport system permease protein